MKVTTLVLKCIWDKEVGSRDTSTPWDFPGVGLGTPSVPILSRMLCLGVDGAGDMCEHKFPSPVRSEPYSFHGIHHPMSYIKGIGKKYPKFT